MSESLSERLDALLADLPENAWTINHDPERHVATIVIDWRLVPGERGSELHRTGKLRV